MDNLFRWISGGVAAIIGWLSDIHALLICALIFVCIDFATGVWASRARAKRMRCLKEWGFESEKAWRTVYKLFFVLGGIVLSWMIENYILTFVDFKLAHLFTGFVCGVEFWSYLENAAEISRHPIFGWLKKFMKKKVGDALDTDINKIQGENEPRIEEQ